MYQLTEENIKHSTLSFLKTYYKNNSSRGFGNTIATLDMKAGNGIIADGYLQFSVEHDPIQALSFEEAEMAFLENKETEEKKKKTFLATFEATSQATAEEIQYRVQNTLLIFDALAIASMMAASSYGYNYLNDQLTLNQLGTFKFFAGFFAVMLVSMIAYIFLFRNLPRYRYIFAIAQFKRYQADEQWVSYGEDVFANPNNKYLLELKKQCIKQGFGLIAVNQNLQPNLVITPARENKKGVRRKVQQFFENKTSTNKALKWIKSDKIPQLQVDIDTEDYKRYTKSYWKQGIVLAAMLFVMGEIYWEELKNPNIVYVDESKYENTLKNAPKNERKEADFPIQLDREATEETRNNKKSKRPIITKKESTPTPKKEVLTPALKREALIISTGLEEYVSYDCSRLSTLKGKHFVVQIATANNAREAVQKVIAYNKDGFRSNAVWLGCFTNKKEYVVYLDDIYKNKNDAAERASAFQKMTAARNAQQTALIRMIQGKGK